MTLNSYEQEQARKKAYYEFAQEQVKLSNLRRAEAYYVSRKNRTEHPDGKLKGRPGKWYPHPKEEHRSCCDYIRSPSRACPYSLMTHCRSAKHIGNLLEVDPKEIKRLARMETKAHCRKTDAARKLSLTQRRSLGLGLLPTPIAGDWKGQRRKDGTASMLSGVIALLPVSSCDCPAKLINRLAKRKMTNWTQSCPDALEQLMAGSPGSEESRMGGELSQETNEGQQWKQ